MLEMFLKMQNKRRAKGGFTLVELIVVLVILAILAALLIPALTGYIDKAKEKSIIAETRQVVMAAQTLVDEKYGTKDTGTAITVESTADPAVTKDAANITKDQITALAEVKGTIGNVKLSNNKIAKLTYTDTNGKTCTYTETPAEGHDKYEVN